MSLIAFGKKSPSLDFKEGDGSNRMMGEPQTGHGKTRNTLKKKNFPCFSVA